MLGPHTYAQVCQSAASIPDGKNKDKKKIRLMASQTGTDKTASPPLTAAKCNNLQGFSRNLEYFQNKRKNRDGIFIEIR